MDSQLEIPSNHRLAERDLIALVENGRWRIDEEGRVWIVRLYTGRVLAVQRRAEKVLESGYLMVRAVIGDRRVVGLAHRLVWQHRFGDIEPGKVINHLDGVKGCNRPDNLEVTTYSGNAIHAYDLGLRDEYGEINPAAKLTDDEVEEIRTLYAGGGLTMEAIGRLYGVRFQHISRLVKGQRRPMQGGPLQDGDLRHSVSPRDPVTGQFLRPEARS